MTDMYNRYAITYTLFNVDPGYIKHASNTYYVKDLAESNGLSVVIWTNRRDEAKTSYLVHSTSLLSKVIKIYKDFPLNRFYIKLVGNDGI